MTVEAATYISDLNTSYPEAGSAYSDVDNHLRLVKSAVKASFTGVTGAVTATHTELNKLAGFSGSIRSTTPIAGEWVLLKSSAVSATVSAMDFVNGTGGVVISSTYDAYRLELDEILLSGAMGLNLQLSSDAGVTFPSNGTGTIAQSAAIAAGTQTITNTSGGGSFPVTGGQSSSATAAADCLYATIVITRRPSGELQAGIRSDWTWSQGARGGFCVGVSKTTGSAFDAIRLTPASGGSFQIKGVIKLFGRAA